MKAKTKRILGAIIAPPLLIGVAAATAMLVNWLGLGSLILIFVLTVSYMAYTYPGWKDDE